MTEPLLRARGVSVERAGVAVVRGVDLDLRAGEVVVVIGPNGAGKSTLLASLAGLLPPAAGRIERRGRVAAVLQAPALARRPARANVEAALAWWGVPRAARRDRALAALSAIGARDLAERPAGALSGGEARRVHLARGLALAPDALLLDEPFAGLDAPTRAELLYDAASVLRDERRATLVVVHDRVEAWALADRVVVMLDGRVAADGAPAAVFGEPPTPEVAAFVGFVGRLDEPGAVLMLRPQDVAIDEGGALRARVTRLVPVEDGVRVELALDRGRVVATAPAPGPRPGTEVRVRLLGGVTFPR
ncbi:MAG: thiamine transport system ATP-binding protein [Solirubrobacteraceae bacterium]|nr:thiamine transport system ATP-binding protein [Solirubrobacteraceae bacterium]